MSSSVSVMPPVVAALKSAIEFTGKATSPWKHIIPEQRKFLNGIYKPYIVNGYLNFFSEKEMRCVASFSHEEINKFLSDNGFDIKLDKFEDPTDFGAAAIMDILVEWVEKAQSVNMIVAKEGKVTSYPSIKISNSFDTFLVDDIIYARIDLNQKDDKFVDSMYLAKGPFTPDQIKTLRETSAEEIFNVKRKEYQSYSSVTIPKIDLNCESDLSYLLGMSFMAKLNSSEKEEEMCLSQALQQTKLKLNEHGARAKSAAAVAVTRFATSIRPKENPLVFDEPFLLWMIKEDLHTGDLVDYFTAYLDIDCWKDPGDLSSM